MCLYPILFPELDFFIYQTGTSTNNHGHSLTSCLSLAAEDLGFENKDGKHLIYAGS